MLITVCFVVATSAPCFGLQRPSTGRTWVTFFIQNFVVGVHQQNYIYSTEILKHNQEYINVEIILDVHLFFFISGTVDAKFAIKPVYKCVRLSQVFCLRISKMKRNL